MKSVKSVIPRDVSDAGAVLMSGREFARGLRAELRADVAALQREHRSPGALLILLVGERQDSILYAQNLVRWFTSIGLECRLQTLPEDAPIQAVQATIVGASHDPAVAGILVQMPLPTHLIYHDVFAAMLPVKDVEGLHPENIGLLASGMPRFVPSTPLAGMALLDANGVALEGKHVAILGRSNVVGKPLAQLMLARNATVTLLHSRSRDITGFVRSADVVAAAAGVTELVTGAMIKPGAIVLDFGINVVDDAIVGDVQFETVRQVASMITPVPGGIGPLTNLMLARNLLTAADLQRGVS